MRSVPRYRIILLALLLAPATIYWTRDQRVDSMSSLLVPPVVITLLVALGNRGLQHIRRCAVLSEGELVIFYGMHSLMGALCAEWMTLINPYIHSYALYHKSNSQFDRYIIPYSHPWFFILPRDADKFQDYRHGGFPPFYFLSKLSLWWPYIASWTLLVTLICLAMLCINSLMRDEWTKDEKLTFPIIQLPVAIVQFGVGKSNVHKQHSFLIPFGIMFLIDILNGLHFFFPFVPAINVRSWGNLAQFFPALSTNAIGSTPIGIYPYLAVTGFFIPTDVLFSCIFFFFFRKFQQLVLDTHGSIKSPGGMSGGGGLASGLPYFGEQSWGAILAICTLAGWRARGYLKEVGRQILHGNPADDPGVPHRVALGCFLASIVGILTLTQQIGIPLWLAGLNLVLFFVFSTALTLIRAQVGIPSHEMAFIGPNQMVTDFVGTQGVSQASISRFITTFFLMNRIHRTHPMPHQLEAMKMGRMAQSNQRLLCVALLLATLFGSVLGHLAYIQHGYRFGAAQTGSHTADLVVRLTTPQRPPNPAAISVVLISFAFALMLGVFSIRIPGFPFHPAGYVLAMNFGLDNFWFGLAIVLCLKLLFERYNSTQGSRLLHNAALGVLLAEFCADTIWAFYAMVSHDTAYSISVDSRTALGR